jgi:pantoate--beta-alanine ligase
MQIFTHKLDLQNYFKSVNKQTTIGFVPTMGALHEGHLSLLRASIAENDFTVISIFVNPTQFNNPKDLEKYPRTITQDIEKIKTVSQQIIIYTPESEDVYGQNLNAETFDFDGLEDQMEGKFRPGHFDGVGTVVKKLFEIVQPTNAYFGEKDFQQLQIIKKLVEKQNIKVNIIPISIFREKNGLAMSSRNERLSVDERKTAAIIYQTLLAAKSKFETETIFEIKEFVTAEIAKNPNFKLEYFEIAEQATLIPIEVKSLDRSYRAFIAVFVNEIRLIDTIAL